MSCQSGSTFSKARALVDTIAAKPVILIAASISTTILLISFQKRPRDSKGLGGSFEFRNVKTEGKRPNWKDVLKKEVLVGI
jgi:hypothetical protein